MATRLVIVSHKRIRRCEIDVGPEPGRRKAVGLPCARKLRAHVTHRAEDLNRVRVPGPRVSVIERERLLVAFLRLEPAGLRRPDRAERRVRGS